MHKPAESLGTRLRAARCRTALTQGQVAELSGFATGKTYGLVERGIHWPSVPRLTAVCDTLCVSADVILGRDDSVIQANAQTGIRRRVIGLVHNADVGALHIVLQMLQRG